MNWLAMDIGGANLKVADGNGFAEVYPFAMWKESKQLAQELRTLIAQSPFSDHLAVTMTGELADCFDNKAAGVTFILEAVERAADRRHTRVYLNNGMLVTPQVAARRPYEVAAANWYALAVFARRFVKKSSALLIDVGSTTCDIVPLFNGAVESIGKNDTDRLIAGELIYTGVERSPVCGLVDKVPFRNQTCPVMQELFATTQDVYVLLGLIPEDMTNVRTADGRPSSKACARVRLGRLLGADVESFNHRDAVILAQAVADTQSQRIAGGIMQVASRLPLPPVNVMISGMGEFLIRRALESTPLQVRVISIAQELGPKISRCGPAHALAVLAREAAGP